MRYYYFPEAGRQRQSTSILTMRCDYFPRAGRRRKSAILTTTFHYFPRAASGRQSLKQKRREKRREKRMPKSTGLDRALERMQVGAAEVNLMTQWWDFYHGWTWTTNWHLWSHTRRRGLSKDPRIGALLSTALTANYMNKISSPTHFTFSPLSVLFRQVGFLFRTVGSFIRQSLRLQLSGNHVNLGLPSTPIRQCCFPLQKLKLLPGCLSLSSRNASNGRYVQLYAGRYIILTSTFSSWWQAALQFLVIPNHQLFVFKLYIWIIPNHSNYSKLFQLFLCIWVSIISNIFNYFHLFLIIPNYSIYF